MIKIYKKLTKDQEKRGVIFSSCLSTSTTELEEDNIHEVTKQEYKEDDRKADEKIKRLLDDKFFSESHFKYNIIRRL